MFAGDHGVHAQGVSPWPQEVTTQMVANFLAGGAAVNVLARQAGAQVVVVDVGMAGDVAPAPAAPAGPAASALLDRKVRRGTADLSTGPAMTVDEAQQALDAAPRSPPCWWRRVPAAWSPATWASPTPRPRPPSSPA